MRNVINTSRNYDKEGDKRRKEESEHEHGQDKDIEEESLITSEFS